MICVKIVEFFLNKSEWLLENNLKLNYKINLNHNLSAKFIPNLVISFGSIIDLESKP